MDKNPVRTSVFYATHRTFRPLMCSLVRQIVGLYVRFGVWKVLTDGVCTLSTFRPLMFACRVSAD